MSLALELGQVQDDYARRALEQIALQCPGAIVPAAAVGPTPIYTTLPATGPEGQVAILRDSAMDANGCAWQARRRTADGQWDFIGGADYRLKAATQYQCAAANTWETPSTAVMPRWTCPASGLYRFAFGFQFRQQVSTAIECYMGIGASPFSTPIDSLRTNLGSVTAGVNILHFDYETQVSLTAGQVIAAMHNTQTAAANVLYVGQWILVKPVRFF